jgi:hypothetical protein
MISFTVGANIFSNSIYYKRKKVTRPGYIYSFDREGIELAADWADREHFCLGFRILRLAYIRRMRSTKRVRIISGDQPFYTHQINPFDLKLDLGDYLIFRLTQRY